jgi:hypothetical protein
MQLTADECLARAWTHCAPKRKVIEALPFGGFPTGFWPDVARVAMAMFEQQTATPLLDFRPTMCEHGGEAIAVRTSKKLKGLDLGKLEINL